MSITPIDEMPALKARLGKHRVDRIRYLRRANAFKQAGARNLTNTVITSLQGYQPWDVGCAVADLLTGVARLDYGNNATEPCLDVTRLYTLLQTLPLINSREIVAMTELSPRQAQRYMQACKVAMPLLERHFARPENCDTVASSLLQ